MAADPGLPPVVRRVGSLRHRRRRQLRRAGRLHRPLPDRPRRRRRGRGRPDHGTDAIWSHRWYAQLAGRRPGRLRRRATSARRRRSSGGHDDPEQPDRRLGRRLHDPAGERRPRRLRARVRPRPRPAGSLRHVGQHRRRRELDRLLDAHVLGREHRRRRPDGIGDDPTDLGAWEKFQLGWLDFDVAEAGKPYDVAPARDPARVGTNDAQRQAGPRSSSCRDKQQATSVVAAKTGS